jgi:hypothetical protein
MASSSKPRGWEIVRVYLRPEEKAALKCIARKRTEEEDRFVSMCDVLRRLFSEYMASESSRETSEQRSA